MKRCPKCNEPKNEHSFKEHGKTTSVCGLCANKIAELVKQVADAKKGSK